MSGLSSAMFPARNALQNGISTQRNVFQVSEQSQRLIDETRRQIQNGGGMWQNGVNSQTNNVNSWSSMNGVNVNSNNQAVPNDFNSWTSTNGNGMNKGDMFNSGFNSWAGLQTGELTLMEMRMEEMMEEEKRRREEENSRMEEVQCRMVYNSGHFFLCIIALLLLFDLVQDAEAYMAYVNSPVGACWSAVYLCMNKKK